MPNDHLLVRRIISEIEMHSTGFNEQLIVYSKRFDLLFKHFKAGKIVINHFTKHVKKVILMLQRAFWFIR